MNNIRQRKITKNAVTVEGKKYKLSNKMKLDVVFHGRDYMITEIIECGCYGKYAVFSEFKRLN